MVCVVFDECQLLMVGVGRYLWLSTACEGIVHLHESCRMLNDGRGLAVNF